MNPTERRTSAVNGTRRAVRHVRIATIAKWEKGKGSALVSVPRGVRRPLDVKMIVEEEGDYEPGTSK